MRGTWLTHFHNPKILLKGKERDDIQERTVLFDLRLFSFVISRKDFFVFNKVLSLELCPGNIFQMDGQIYLLKTSNKIVQGEMVSGFPKICFLLWFFASHTNFLTDIRIIKKNNNKKKTHKQNKK